MLVSVFVGDVRCSVGGELSGEAMQSFKRQRTVTKRVNGWDICMV